MPAVPAASPAGAADRRGGEARPAVGIGWRHPHLRLLLDEADRARRTAPDASAGLPVRAVTGGAVEASA